MQIVIDIPNSLYANLKKIQGGSIASKRLLDCIKKGTPLPKGHGDLIDRKEVCRLEEELCVTECGCCGLDGCFYDKAKTIIEADKVESEE